MKKNQIKLIIFLLIFIIFETNKVISQIDTNDINNYYIDFPVQDNSAITLLGIDVNKVSRPGSMKELGAQLVNFLSSGSKLAQGIALEWSPLLTFSNSVQKYQNSYYYSNFQLSLATVKNGDSATDIGIGLTYTPLDETDLLKDGELSSKFSKKINDFYTSSTKWPVEFLQSFRTSFKSQFPIIAQQDRDWYFKIYEVLAPAEVWDGKKDPLSRERFVSKSDSIFNASNFTLNNDDKGWIKNMYVKFLESLTLYKTRNDPKTLNKELSKLLDDQKKYWNKSIIKLSIGTVLNSEDSKWKNLKNKMFSTYFGGSLRLWSHGQIVGHFQYMKAYNDSAADKMKLIYGGRLVMGSNDFRASIEASYSKIDKKDPTQNIKKVKATLGFEYNVSDGFWLETAVGIDSPWDKIKEADFTSLIGGKYSFNKKPRFYKE